MVHSNNPLVWAQRNLKPNMALVECHLVANLSLRDLMVEGRMGMVETHMGPVVIAKHLVNMVALELDRNLVLENMDMAHSPAMVGNMVDNLLLLATLENHLANMVMEDS